jgi:hypothetical protein
MPMKVKAPKGHCFFLNNVQQWQVLLKFNCEHVFLGMGKYILNYIYFLLEIAQIQSPGCINSPGREFFKE